MFDEIKIDETLKNLAEAYDYEYSTRRDTITFMLTNNMDITTDSFKAYQKEMNEFYVKFNKVKDEIQNQYVLPIIGDKKVSWTLNYETGLLTITEIG